LRNIAIISGIARCREQIEIFFLRRYFLAQWLHATLDRMRDSPCDAWFVYGYTLRATLPLLSFSTRRQISI